MTKATKRVKEGRRARLNAEVYSRIQNLPVHYSCVYKQPDHATQYLRGWKSVNQIDIDAAVSLIESTSVTTTRPSLKTLLNNLKGNVPCQLSPH